MLIAAIAMLQPAAALLPAQQLPTVEPVRLEIRSGRLGGPISTIAFEYVRADALRNVPVIRFTGTFLDPRSNTTSRRDTDSIACPDAASILRAVPASATAAIASQDAPLVVLVHGSTYSLSGRIHYPGQPSQGFTMTGDSRTPFGWWTLALMSALNSCWLQPLSFIPPGSSPAPR